ncbi:hypothetical protein M5E06_13315 [Azospirillum sp. A1-3]|uniref:hypothetical protein n=1 Tax=Azospirillum sp. A1-3 TaxID=185874 RepID=UPI0020775CDD|nr:hypothetical protein [Azospirillum sp. A1-3]MCM8735162.1 hypothetical protein [Azospirillum sp. A1-3]
MPKPITGLPRGHVPRYRPPADNSHLFGSYREEAASLKRAADAAEWAGDTAKADELLAKAKQCRIDGATCDLMPLF